MIWTNMSLPSVNYRVQLYDTWAELDFERMDNPREGDKIVYRSLGEDNVPYVSKTEVYSDGAWVEQGGGGGGGATFYVPTQEITIDDSGASVPVSDVSIDGLSVGDHVALKLELIEDEETYYGDGVVGHQSLGPINLTTISCVVTTNHTSIAYDVNFEIEEGGTPMVSVENHSSHTPAEGIYNITVFSI